MDDEASVQPKPRAAQRHREILRFALVGATGFAVDAGVLLLLIHAFDWSKVLARIPSFLVAVTVTWWLHRSFTFLHVRNRAPSVHEWARFLSVNVVGNLVNLGIYTLLVTRFSWLPLAALVVASGAAAAINYLASSTWAFRRDRK